MHFVIIIMIVVKITKYLKNIKKNGKIIINGETSIYVSVDLGMCYAFYVFTLFDPNKSFHKIFYIHLKLKNVKDKQSFQ